MNSVWHCHYKQRTNGHALIAAIILAGVSALLLLSGLNRILYQSKLAAGIDSRQQLHAAARHSLYQATLTAESAGEFPPFSPTRLYNHPWPVSDTGIRHGYLIEQLSLLNMPSSVNYLILTAYAGKRNTDVLFLQALYQQLPNAGQVIKTWQLH